MPFRTLAAVAICAALITGARAELTAQFTLRAGIKGPITVKAIVLCSQYPELNAERLRGFLKEATGIQPDFFFQDGPFQFDAPAPDTEPVQKMILVAAGQEPDQAVIDCVRDTVPFGGKVLEQLAETWRRLGKPPAAQVPYSHLMEPVRSSRKYSYVKDGNGKTEWVIVTGASEFSGTPYEINSTMTSLFGLDDKVCQGNSFCLPQD